jgi:ornithine cyclodeaminase/alanine dehydrogenase-like protein (mu-crystallin family)
MHPKVISPDEIASCLAFDRLIPAIAQGFRDFFKGRAKVPAITNIDLPDVNGEMHIKPGYMVDGDHVCVKIATCYYNNPKKGLPTRDGMIVLASRTNGRIEAILYDAGLITDMRTAAASAVAVDALARPGPVTLGLVGSGTQAYWHARAISFVRPITKTVVWGRDPARVDAALERIRTAAKLSVESGTLEAVAGCDVVVTATPAKNPVLNRETLKPGALLVAMGADAAGKRELGGDVLNKASTIVADSLAQCRVIGELQWLKTTGAQPRVAELGAILSGAEVGRRAPDEIIVFDSTGLGFQDVVGASQVVGSMTN